MSPNGFTLSSPGRAGYANTFFGSPKPNPKILHGTIDRAGGSRDSTVMVDDSITDIATARAAAIPVIAVDFGYTDIPVRDFHADQVISAFSELPVAVNSLLSLPVGNILS